MQQAPSAMGRTALIALLVVNRQFTNQARFAIRTSLVNLLEALRPPFTRGMVRILQFYTRDGRLESGLADNSGEKWCIIEQIRFASAKKALGYWVRIPVTSNHSIGTWQIALNQYAQRAPVSSISALYNRDAPSL
ncbi:uncharacterized protein K444DRAFT_85632 [Hyaloscypha bicolor E]|uniref:Uncharacterized protein n=1 Tax=Hyaloscypha bicolor E TaxID=1095630 RepID=A0A2J6SYX7_9HELO|nr:uncharacterized protein K444DRAFT_85632 [Hyaloscypha bicolor E]PMD55966.1 hypothetical protein K444DRAFT_85632 [Hyaloscypha bicolor E]